MSAAFILSAARADNFQRACAQALSAAPQDALFGWDAPNAAENLPALACPSVSLNSSLRALAYAAQSLENAQASLIFVAGGLPGDYAAFLLAAPEIIGARNLDPLAQLSAWSFNGLPRALAKAEIAEEDLACRLSGPSGVLAAYETLTTLQREKTRWGLAAVSESFLLLERN
ncbi:MAG: hypothetical protein OHK0031_04540 [Anaerolineales bacterium]